MTTRDESSSSSSSSSSFVLIALQLNAAQASATTLEAREEADADMSHFLRMAHAGRLDEWKASRGDQLGDVVDTKALAARNND